MALLIIIDYKLPMYRGIHQMYYFTYIINVRQLWYAILSLKRSSGLLIILTVRPVMRGQDLYSCFVELVMDVLMQF